jgi:hypothetical protein
LIKKLQEKGFNCNEPITWGKIIKYLVIDKDICINIFSTNSKCEYPSCCEFVSNPTNYNLIGYHILGKDSNYFDPNTQIFSIRLDGNKTYKTAQEAYLAGAEYAIFNMI